MKLIKAVVGVGIILLIVLVSYNLLNKKNNTSNNMINNVVNRVSKKDKKEFVDFYVNEVRRVVLNKIFDNENPVCTTNCKEIYGISNDNIDFEVLDIQDNFEVVYKATEIGKYNNINLKNDDCKTISDTTCNSSIIKNYISKNWVDKR